MSGDNIVQDLIEFSQQFLFELTTTTPVISMQTEESKQTIYSDSFTKENVVINIKKGTEFDSSVRVVVSKAEFSDNTLFREITTLTSNDYKLVESGKYKIETKYGKDFKKTRERDENKYKLLKEHNIKLLYFTKKKFYKEKIHEECTIFSINDLLKELEKEQ